LAQWRCVGFFLFSFSFFFFLPESFSRGQGLELTFVFAGDPEIEAKIMENPDALEKGSVDEVLEAVGHPRPGWLARKKAAKAAGKKK
jgi:hypothetical protein